MKEEMEHLPRQPQHPKECHRHCHLFHSSIFDLNTMSTAMNETVGDNGFSAGGSDGSPSVKRYKVVQKCYPPLIYQVFSSKNAIFYNFYWNYKL
jgi:hypothetical protein